MAVKAGRLGSLVSRAATLVRIASVGRAALIGVAVWLQAVLAAVVLDAWLAPVPRVVLLLSLALLGIAVFVVIRVVIAAARRGMSAEAVALRLEAAAGVADNRLVNAVHLAAGRASAGSASLVSLAVTEGDAAAAELGAADALEQGPLKRAAVVTGVTLLAALVFLLAAPDVFRAVAPRLWSPLADLPPYSRLVFEVKVDPRPADVGRPAVVRVRIGGRGAPPEEAHVVWPGASSSVRSKMVMTNAGRFELTVERVAEAAEYYIDTPGGRSGRYRIEVSSAPLIERLTVSIEPPAYTKRPTVSRVLTGWQPPREAAGDRASPAFAGPEVRVLRGSKVTFTADSNVPLSSGTAVLTPTLPPATQTGAQGTIPLQARASVRTAMPPVAQAPATVSGAFTAERSGRVEIAVDGRKGWVTSASAVASLVVEDDLAPSVRIIEPDDEAVAPVNWKLPVSVVAEDDVAVDRLELNVKLGGSDRQATSWSVSGRGEGVATARGTIDLQKLGAKAGDELVLRAEAADARPGRDGPSRSEAVRVRVLSDSEYAKLAKARYGREEAMAEAEAYRREGERLAKRTRELLDDIDRWNRASQGASSEESEQARQRIESGLEELSEDAARFSEAMSLRARPPHVFDFEREYAEALRAEAERWAQCSGGASQAGRGMNASAGGSAADRAEAGRQVDAGAKRMKQALGDGGERAWREAREAMGRSGDLSRSGPRSGSGASGSSGTPSSQSAMMGPHFSRHRAMSEERSESTASNQASSGSGGDRKPDREKIRASVTGNPADPQDPERYAPAPTKSVFAPAPADVAALPPKFRDQAEAYFRRLAEEK